MRCRFFRHSTAGAALRGNFYRPSTDEVARHPLREKELPSKTAMQRNRTSRDGRKEFEQVQQPIAAIDPEGLAQRPRQSSFADQRQESGSGRFPKAALNEMFQPPRS